MKTPKYEDVLSRHRQRYLEYRGCVFDGEVDCFSSPIEKVFVAAMLDGSWTPSIELDIDVHRQLLEDADAAGLVSDPVDYGKADWEYNPQRVYSLSPKFTFCATQHWIQLAKKRIRPDFAFVLPGENETRIIVELDGHDWHERTPEQAQSDKSRDRELQTLGWHVMRFTGREVLREPQGCLIEVQRLLYAKNALARAAERP